MRPHDRTEDLQTTCVMCRVQGYLRVQVDMQSAPEPASNLLLPPLVSESDLDLGEVSRASKGGVEMTTAVAAWA